MTLLSVAQLVDRTAPPTEAHIPLWQRRIRLWSDSGIIPTVGPHDDTGRHRRYSESTIHLAAVLLRISDFGVERSILEKISSSINVSPKNRGAFARFWRDAIKGNRSTAYICFSLKNKNQISYDAHGHGLVIFSQLVYDEPAIILNLTGVFEEVRRAAEE